MRVIAWYGRDDLRDEEWPTPSPGAGQVRVAIKACCISGLDVALSQDGCVSGLRAPVPFLLCHCAAGLVDTTGADVHNIPPGTPVAIDPLIPCGTCHQCQQGRFNVCIRVRYLGVPPTHGALAEYVVVPAANIVPVDARVSFGEIACTALLAAGIHATAKAGVSSVSSLGIFGAGGIGQACLLAARACGARVIVMTDTNPTRLVHARQAGAEHVITAGTQSVADDILEMTDGNGLEIALVATSAPQALNDAIAAAAPGGRVAIVNMPHEPDLSYAASQARAKELCLQHVAWPYRTMRAAADMLTHSTVNLASWITQRVPWEKAEEAFAHAALPQTDAMRISLEPEEFDEPFHP
jgi:L-iditol 2-dehydrogenase